MWNAIKDFFTLITRVMRLEDRVSAIEKKIEKIQTPLPNVRDGLNYNKKWNYYENASTGECFCSTCLGNGKRIAVKVQEYGQGLGWHCNNCKLTQWEK